MESKRNIMYPMVILALAEVGIKEAVPLLTMQVNEVDLQARAQRWSWETPGQVR
jgi:hypothetical protein